LSTGAGNSEFLWSTLLRQGVLIGGREAAAAEVSRVLHSAIATVLVPRPGDGAWQIAPGWENGKLAATSAFSLSSSSRLVQDALANEVAIADPRIGRGLPSELAGMGLQSALCVAIGHPESNALLLVAGSNSVAGRSPWLVSYTLKDVDLAAVIGRVLGANGFGAMQHQEEVAVATRNQGRATAPWERETRAWELDRPSLLKTHNGWFAAYCGSQRVALEPTTELLAARLESVRGDARAACMFVRVCTKVPERRRPSPRWPRPAPRNQERDG
jgi:hypothetical protein